MYDIAIVGAGPAGMSAAIYGVRGGKSVLMIEADTYGGQIINTPEIENYPAIRNISGFDFAQNLYQQATGLGAEFKSGRVTSIDNSGEVKKLTLDNGETVEAKTVILATGEKNRQLGLPNEKELVGKGVSYCATCDGMFYRKKDVAVNGGGNTALEDALFLANLCNKVYVIHRREGFRGEPSKLAALQKRDNVEFVLNATVSGLIAEDRLTGVEVEDKFSHEKRVIPVSGLFVAIGQVPSNADFASLVDEDQSGYIKGGEDCRTNAEGIFVAGDCRTKNVRQLTTAAADGAVAALAACNYIDR